MMDKEPKTTSVTVDASEIVPLEDVITENTVHIEERSGKYSNTNAVGRYCDCICHVEGQNIMHCVPCCDYTAMKSTQNTSRRI